MIHSNPAHVTNFRLDIPDSGGTIAFEMAVQGLGIPGININPIEIPINPMTTGKLPGTAVDFEPLNIRVLLDEELSAYVEVYKWMLSVVDYAKLNSTAQIEGTVPRTLLLHVLDNSKKKIVLTFKFIDAWPSNLGEVEFTYTDESNSPIVLPVQFMYKSFVIEKDGVEIRPYVAGSNGSAPTLHPFYSHA
ncbi:tail tube terminator protein [Aeromonas phage avDM12-TAAL]|nr:tail tube terminator protein [Aeromonas phage avDM12-TAAL]